MDDVRIRSDVFHILSSLKSNVIPYAFISDRAVEDISRLMSSHYKTWAGMHGAEICYPNGEYERLNVCEDDIACVWERLEVACMQFPGLKIENKAISLAIHYRQTPRVGRGSVKDCVFPG